MFTELVSEADAIAFAQLLGVPLLSTDVLYGHTDRASYFGACQQGHHLFLDPDTGVRVPPKSKPRQSYLFPDELISLCMRKQDRLILAFDQSLSRGQERPELAAKLELFARQGVHGFAYSSHTSFLVVSASDHLARDAEKTLLAASGLPEARFVRLMS